MHDRHDMKRYRTDDDLHPPLLTESGWIFGVQSSASLLKYLYQSRLAPVETVQLYSFQCHKPHRKPCLDYEPVDAFSAYVQSLDRLCAWYRKSYRSRRIITHHTPPYIGVSQDSCRELLIEPVQKGHKFGWKTKMHDREKW